MAKGSVTRVKLGTTGIQSTKPLQAEREALLAVSTVPPRTTSFCGGSPMSVLAKYGKKVVGYQSVLNGIGVHP